MPIHLRLASHADIPALRRLIDASVRTLQAHDYSPRQLDLALRTVYGVDTQLIADGTYFLAFTNDALAGCGGWSRRRTLYGGDHFASREDALLDPATEAAKIRAFFIHPDFARQGVASRLLAACEDAARAAGFRRLELGATLTGLPFYRARGYRDLESLAAPLDEGESLPIVRMAKSFS